MGMAEHVRWAQLLRQHILVHQKDTVRRRAPTTMQVRMAPKMGIADFITAAAPFDQLAERCMEDDEERHISAEILQRWQFLRVVHACTHANAQIVRSTYG